MTDQATWTVPVKTGMTEKTKAILSEKLNSKHIAKRKQGGMDLSYIESHHAIREANRAFDFDGWSYEIKELFNVSEETNHNSNHVIGYMARVVVIVGGVIREDVGFGSGISKSLADAHEGACKEAVSDAMKRALRTFGDIFGLALYDKKQEHVEQEPDPAYQLVLNFLDKVKTTESLKEFVEENSKQIKSSPKYNEIRKRLTERKEELLHLAADSQGMRDD